MEWFFFTNHPLWGDTMATFLLLHSPFVGPATWNWVAQVLKQRKIPAIVPILRHRKDEPPYWKQHVDQVVTALEHLTPKEPIILVAHSGAGVLIPVVADAIRQPTVGSIFVDALIPQDGKSRLDLYNTKEAADEFRRQARDGMIPPWTEDDLKTAIPAPSVRRTFVAQLYETPLAMYEEPIPVPDGWPGHPCVYWKWTEHYEPQRQIAEQAGWRCIETKAGHFYLLQEPEVVADQLVEIGNDLLQQAGLEPF